MHPQIANPMRLSSCARTTALGTLFNMVGFQTKLTYGEQKSSPSVQTIPGLENAEFARLGGLHRNTFINSPALLDGELRLKSRPHIRFAGQITGCEGYVESAAVGLMAGTPCCGRSAGTGREGARTTDDNGHGSAFEPHHIRAPMKSTFQPMNINFGLFPPLAERMKKRERKPAMARRALADLDDWQKSLASAA